jgi:hypothetical protein
VRAPKDSGKRIQGLLYVVIGVVNVPGGVRACVKLSDGWPVHYVGPARATLADAQMDARGVRNTLAAILMPFVKDLLSEAACGCTDKDPVACADVAVRRLGLGVVAFCQCPTCHPCEQAEAPDQGMESCPDCAPWAPGEARIGAGEVACATCGGSGLVPAKGSEGGAGADD